MVLGFGFSRLLSGVVGLAYPSYSSFKAIITPETEDDGQWLVYWIVYAFWTLIESIISPIAVWIPFFFEAKLLVLLWLQIPQFEGSLYIFKKFVQPFLDSHDTFFKLDALTTKSKEFVRDIPAHIKNAPVYAKNLPVYIEKVKAQLAALQKKTAPAAVPTPAAPPAPVPVPAPETAPTPVAAELAPVTAQ